jgi:integrase
VWAAPRVPISQKDSGLTVGAALDSYLSDFVHTPGRRTKAAAQMARHVEQLRTIQIPSGRGRERLGDKILSAVSAADIEAVKRERQKVHARVAEKLANGEALAASERKPGVKHGETGIHRLLARARHFFNWCCDREWIDATPFRRKSGRAVLGFTKGAGRVRRLCAGEEERLLAHADPRLHDLIVALLNTCCRVGELLSLRWKDIREEKDASGVLTPRAIILSGTKTKTFQPRTIGINRTLAAVLMYRRLGPDGARLPDDSYVFGSRTGRKMTDYKRGFVSCVLRANGHTPTYSRTRAFSRESCDVFRAIDLHIHDLRREAASRLLDKGIALTSIQQILGHSSVSQTAQYLAATSSQHGEALSVLDAPAPSVVAPGGPVGNQDQDDDDVEPVTVQ